MRSGEPPRSSAQLRQPSISPMLPIMSRLVFATDLHLTEGHGGLDAFAVDLQEIAALSPDLLVLGGDVCLWEPGAGEHLQHLLHDLPCPVAHLMGNHDTDRNGSAAAFDSEFVSRFGSRNAYADLGDAHVITLNTCRLQPEFNDWRNVRAEVCADDLTWLETTLAGLIPNRPLLVFVHIPLATTYPERRSADRDTTDVWRVTNADEVLARLATWSGPVIIGQGHLHENEHLHRHGMHLVSLGAVCGRWWQHGEQTRCTDNSPRGWLVADVAQEAVHLEFRAARAPASWQGEITTKGGERWLNLFFGDPAETVEILCNGEWIELPAATPIAVDDTFFSVHHWLLPTACRADAIEVRTRLRDQPWNVGRVHQAE
jgi:3',5'-cyclic AMP phosphodiesterase CpdA